MSAHTEYRPTEIAIPVNRLARVVALALLFVAFGAVAALGGYLYGQSDKPDTAAAAAKQAAAMRSAVTRAVDAKGAEDHLKRLRIEARALTAQRREYLALMDRMLLKEQRAGDRRAAAAFTRGQAVGRALAAGGTTPAKARKPRGHAE